MSTRPEIYRDRSKICEHLAAAAGDDLETRQRALDLAQKWEIDGARGSAVRKIGEPESVAQNLSE